MMIGSKAVPCGDQELEGTNATRGGRTMRPPLGVNDQYSTYFTITGRLLMPLALVRRKV